MEQITFWVFMSVLRVSVKVSPGTLLNWNLSRTLVSSSQRAFGSKIAIRKDASPIWCHMHRSIFIFMGWGMYPHRHRNINRGEHNFYITEKTTIHNCVIFSIVILTTKILVSIWWHTPSDMLEFQLFYSICRLLGYCRW